MRETQAQAVLQWFGYMFQYRRKPGVMPQFLSEAEGTGKSAIFGHNQSGPGLIARIYGQYYQWSDDIDRLLGKFNHDSMNRLFCVNFSAAFVNICVNVYILNAYLKRYNYIVEKTC